jgi:hypothetical protein
VKNIVKNNKQSVMASDELRKTTNGDGKHIQEMATRWNSTYYMVERFIKLSKIVNDIVHKNIIQLHQ